MKFQFRKFKPPISGKDTDCNKIWNARNSIAEQHTMPLPSIQPPGSITLSDPSHTMLGSLLGPLKRQYIALLNQMLDPEPEGEFRTLRQKPMKSQTNVLGWLPILTLTSALGILLGAFAYASSMHTSTDEQNILWLGLLVVFVPPFLRIISPISSRPERIGLICIVCISLYLVKMVLSPNQFFFFDEYLHWRTVDDIVRSGHLFSQNTLLPVSPLYPGLEIVTDAFSTLSGLNTYVSALIVIGISRILMVLSLFMLFEQITKSARTAGIAVMIYICSPNFFIFDSLFIYESLGLALGTFMLFALARTETVDNGGRGLLITAWIAMGALTVTHHVSDFFFLGLLVLWAIISKFQRIVPALRSNPAKTALLGILLSAAWIIFVARPVIDYLSSPINVALVGIENVLTGVNSVRHLFVDYSAGHQTPIWQQLVMLSSLCIVSFSLPFSFLCIWHRYRHNTLALMLGLVSFFYPLSQVFRLISNGADITFRAAPYCFIPTGFVLAVFITQIWPTRLLKWKQSVLITLAVTLVFLGGALLGNGPSWTLLPGNYVVGDDSRTINQESIQAAIWTLSHLGPNNRMATDRNNQILMGTYGDQRIVTFTQDKVDYTPVFLSTGWYQGEVVILQNARVQYLVVDLRLSTSPPFSGFYFEEVEPGAYQLTRPISRQALTKFDAVSQINKEFDSGNIVIYDVGTFTNDSGHI